VRFRSNWRELKGVSPESDFYDAAVRSIGGALYNSWVLADSPAQVSAVVKVVAAHREAYRERGQASGIKGTRSLDDLIPADQEAKLPLLRALERQLRRLKPEQLSAVEQKSLGAALALTEARPFGLVDLPDSLRAASVAPDGRTSLVTLVSDWEFNDSDELAAWAEEMSALSAELHRAGLETPIISEDWIAGSVFQTMKQDGWFIIGGSLLVVFLVVWADFRSLRQASLVLVALAIGQVSIAGAMRLFGIELNFINSAVLRLVPRRQRDPYSPAPSPGRARVHPADPAPDGVGHDFVLGDEPDGLRRDDRGPPRGPAQRRDAGLDRDRPDLLVDQRLLPAGAGGARRASATPQTIKAAEPLAATLLPPRVSAYPRQSFRLP
jgi:hypothetical protein